MLPEAVPVAERPAGGGGRDSERAAETAARRQAGGGGGGFAGGGGFGAGGFGRGGRAGTAPRRPDPPQPEVKLTILDSAGNEVRALEGPGTAGLHQVVWDLRLEPPYVPDPQQGEGGFGGRGGGGFGGRGGRSFGGAPRGPTVLPGSFSVRLDAGEQTASTAFEVRMDPRIQVSRADLEARQEAMMISYRLAKPTYEAGRALQRLDRQLGDVRELLSGREEVPDPLREMVRSIAEELDAIRQESTQGRRRGRGGLGGANFEGWTGRPTDDQMWSLRQTLQKTPAFIGRINVLITERLPELYSMLDEHGIRPDPGAPIQLPSMRER